MAKAIKKNVHKLKEGVSTLFQYLASFNKKFEKFSPKVRIYVDRGDFYIRTAENAEDLKKAMTLRHEIFYEELLARHESLGLDMDKFDFLCDHLMIIEKQTDKLVGTYRLNSSLFNKKFYSATEFKMKNIKKLSGNKLELGRACIDKNHRNGITISLLWLGIGEYLKATDTRYMFGCSSVKTIDPEEVALVTKFLMEKYPCKATQKVKPRKKFKTKGLKKFLKKLENPELYDKRAGKKMVPSLLKSYLNLGGVVCGKPALDLDFKCIDFLTLVDVTTMKQSVLRKFSDVGLANLSD